jgi:hypothetical protein
MTPIGALKLGAAISALALTATQVSGQATSAPPTFRHGEIGFVVSQIRPAMGEAPGSAACPEGLSISTNDLYKKSLTAEAAAAHDLQLKTALDDFAKVQGGFVGYYDAQTHAEWKNPDGSFICMKPQLAAPDPYYKTAVNVPGEKIEGLDLDGQVSRSNGPAPPGGCAGQDFTGMDGKPGVDNQYYRVFACTRGFHGGDKTGFVSFDADMLQGMWTLVFKLTGVENLQNDDAVDVGVYSSDDPLELDATGAPVANFTYAATTNPRHRSTTKGRIVGGVLTTDPVDMRIKINFNGQSETFEYYVRGARFRLTIAPDGTASGYLAGYYDVETFYRNSIAYADHALISSLASEERGYTCSGVYQALHRLADGNRDPATGKCTSISAALKVKTIAAFVVVPPATTPASGAKR